MRIQVELGFILQAASCQILNFAQNPRQNQRGKGTELHLGGGTQHRKIYAHTFLVWGTIGMRKKTYWKGGHCTYFVDGGNNWGGDSNA